VPRGRDDRPGAHGLRRVRAAGAVVQLAPYGVGGTRHAVSGADVCGFRQDVAVRTRGWVLFAAMSLLWGIPYLFIKETVETFTPFAMVAGRTLGGALILLPFALHRRA